MSDCDQHDLAFEALIDGELTGTDLQATLDHIEHCASCRIRHQEAQALSRLIRQQALRPAPASLHARVEHLLATHAAQEPAPLRVLASPVTPRPPLGRNLLLLAATFCLVAVGLTFVVQHLRTISRANAFLDSAVQNYRAVQASAVPLDVQSSSPEVVANWFRPRVSFPFRMPHAGMAADDQALYTLRGGRLVSFAGSPAALLAFQRAQDLITILVTSNAYGHPAFGSVAYSSGIAFHSLEHRSSHVVTWENQGLLYGLVSPEFQGKGRACSACHEQAGTPSTTQASYRHFDVVRSHTALQPEQSHEF